MHLCYQRSRNEIVWLILEFCQFSCSLCQQVQQVWEVGPDRPANWQPLVQVPVEVIWSNVKQQPLHRPEIVQLELVPVVCGDSTQTIHPELKCKFVWLKSISFGSHLTEDNLLIDLQRSSSSSCDVSRLHCFRIYATHLGQIHSCLNLNWSYRIENIPIKLYFTSKSNHSVWFPIYVFFLYFHRSAWWVNELLFGYVQWASYLSLNK